MPKIVHISRKAFEQGAYADYPIAIRIADSFWQLADVYHPKQQPYAFAFSDVDAGEPGAISELDASIIIGILHYAKGNDQNVVVHCEAGVARSGAVAQFAIDALGFENEVAPATEEDEAWRMPNELVMSRLYEIHALYEMHEDSLHQAPTYSWDILMEEGKRLGLEFPLSSSSITKLVNHMLATEFQKAKQ
jgi:rhodanese-related sulfurtransferase